MVTIEPSAVDFPIDAERRRKLEWLAGEAKLFPPDAQDEQELADVLRDAIDLIALALTGQEIDEEQAVKVEKALSWVIQVIELLKERARKKEPK
jgi:hypothetical protein